jgi:hypothetical protein
MSHHPLHARIDPRLQRHIKNALDRPFIEGVVLFRIWPGSQALVEETAVRLNLTILRLRLLPSAHIAVLEAPPDLFMALLAHDNVLFISAPDIDVF